MESKLTIPNGFASCITSITVGKDEIPNLTSDVQPINLDIYDLESLGNVLLMKSKQLSLSSSSFRSKEQEYTAVKRTLTDYMIKLFGYFSVNEALELMTQIINEYNMKLDDSLMKIALTTNKIQQEQEQIKYQETQNQIEQINASKTKSKDASLEEKDEKCDPTEVNENEIRKTTVKTNQLNFSTEQLLNEAQDLRKSYAVNNSVLKGHNAIDIVQRLKEIQRGLKDVINGFTLQQVSSAELVRFSLSKKLLNDSSIGYKMKKGGPESKKNLFMQIKNFSEQLTSIFKEESFIDNNHSMLQQQNDQGIFEDVLQPKASMHSLKNFNSQMYNLDADEGHIFEQEEEDENFFEDNIMYMDKDAGDGLILEVENLDYNETLEQQVYDKEGEEMRFASKRQYDPLLQQENMAIFEIQRDFEIYTKNNGNDDYCSKNDDSESFMTQNNEEECDNREQFKIQESSWSEDQNNQTEKVCRKFSESYQIREPFDSNHQDIVVECDETRYPYVRHFSIENEPENEDSFKKFNYNQLIFESYMIYDIQKDNTEIQLTNLINSQIQTDQILSKSQNDVVQFERLHFDPFQIISQKEDDSDLADIETEREFQQLTLNEQDDLQHEQQQQQQQQNIFKQLENSLVMDLNKLTLEIHDLREGLDLNQQTQDSKLYQDREEQTSIDYTTDVQTQTSFKLQQSEIPTQTSFKRISGRSSKELSFSFKNSLAQSNQCLQLEIFNQHFSHPFDDKNEEESNASDCDSSAEVVPVQLRRYMIYKRERSYALLVHGDFIFVDGLNNNVDVFNKDDFRFIASLDTGESCMISGIIINERVYIGNSDKHLYIFDLKSFKFVNKIQLANNANSLLHFSTNYLVCGERWQYIEVIDLELQKIILKSKIEEAGHLIHLIKTQSSQSPEVAIAAENGMYFANVRISSSTSLLNNIYKKDEFYFKGLHVRGIIEIGYHRRKIATCIDLDDHLYVVDRNERQIIQKIKMVSGNIGPICLRMVVEDAILIRDQDGVNLVDLESNDCKQLVQSPNMLAPYPQYQMDVRIDDTTRIISMSIIEYDGVNSKLKRFEMNDNFLKAVFFVDFEDFGIVS